MAALSFIGKSISLISHSDVRYRGILAGIDPVASTIQLSNVYSMGTESRRPPDQFIPPVQDPYTYIIFRASEVKDLAVDDPALQRRNVHDDPAVLGASAPQLNSPYNGFAAAAYPAQAAAAAHQQPQGIQRQQSFGQASGSQQTNGTGQAQAATGARRNTAVNSATASLETVERALGDLRVSNAAANGRGGRRGKQEIKAGDLRIPTTEFDFQSSNARFDKSALAPKTPKTEDSPEGEATNGKAKEEDRTTAYNPKSSFFDTLSSGSNGPQGDGRGRGGRRGGGRNRREEERERNVATFGEPGGIGLMGPGAYVGGWGGHGRRGGGRGRRGGAPVAAR